MNLEYIDEDILNRVKNSQKPILIINLLPIIHLLCLSLFLDSKDLYSYIFILYFLLILALLIIIQVFTIKSYSINNITDSILETAKKDTCYIIEANHNFKSMRYDNSLFNKESYLYPTEHYIIVMYNNKKIKINHLQNNPAFSKLMLLLKDSSNKIPIDIYIYKNKIYPDLRSVKLF